MNQVEIINQTNEEINELETIKKLVDFTLKYQNIENAIFNIIIVDNKTVKEINKEYRGIDRPTDVISFALEDDSSFVKLEYRVLGDIYISIEKVREQAKEYGHSFLRELSFLTVHGILHLLGFDHMNKEDEKVMFKLQELILSEYGVKR